MTQPIDRKALANHLLTDLACRTDGALDFWTLLCVSPVVPDVKAFIRQHCEIMRSLVVVIRSLFGKGEGESLLLLGELRAGCDEWESAFLLLGEHGQHTDCEVVSAVGTLERVYGQRMKAIIELGRSLGAPVARLEEQPDERRAYFRTILTALPDVILQARQEGAV